MNTMTFNAQKREAGIKNASKKAFRNHQIVGVVYNHKENFPIIFDRHDFEKMIPKIRSNTLLKVKVGSQERTTFIKEYTFFLKNHRLQHVDFQEIVPGRPVRIYVPLEYIGNPVGVGKGGFVQISAKNLRVECDSKNIPDTIKIDISDLDVNQRLYLKDAPDIPGVKYMQSPDLGLVSVVLSSRRKSEGGAQVAEEAVDDSKAEKK